MHSLFGAKHIILMCISLVLIVVFFLLSRKLKHRQILKIMFYVGLVAETLKVFYFTITNEAVYGGVLPKSDLPFHLCSIQIIFFAILNFTKNEKVEKYLNSFMLPSCLIGAFAAILLATYSSRNGNFVIAIEYFGYHSALVVYALHLIDSKEIKYELKDYFCCLKFLVLIIFFAFYINSILYDGTSDINFMYVASPPQEGLPFLNENHGWVVYISHYAFLVILGATLCYIKPIFKGFKSLKNKEKIAQT